MKQSQLFTKSRKEIPSDETSKNASLLIRAGFMNKHIAGVYELLPLGLATVNNITNIVREEMNAIGGQELHLSTLQDKNLWEKTGRFDDKVVDVWLKTRLKNDTELGLAFTHEEPITSMMKNFISSYRDLPILAYQFQTKFRNEIRAQSGIIRGREFLMKDLYTFAKTEEEHDKLYQSLTHAYIKIFDKMEIGQYTYLTSASGGVFAKYSHEFQTVADAGGDRIFIDQDKKIAINEEIMLDPAMKAETLKDLGLDESKLVAKRSVEVGNIFSLKTRFSEPLELRYKDETGKSIPVIMGSYGIGITRLMGVIAEVLSDEHGLVWPMEIAPFKVHLLFLGNNKESDSEKTGISQTRDFADNLYKDLNKIGIPVLYDDRDLRPGEKFADADLLGMPIRIVVGEKNLSQGQVEVKDRKTGQVVMIEKNEIIKHVVSRINSSKNL